MTHLNTQLKKEKISLVSPSSLLPLLLNPNTNSTPSPAVIHGYQILKEKPYDERGNMLRHVLMGQQKDVSSLVGYFKFRRQSDVSLSERDQLWMNSYANNVPHGCIAIISSNLNSFADKSTHTYEFAFWDMKNKVK
jgi:hypothetical protein